MKICGFGGAELTFPVEVHFRVIAFSDAETEGRIRTAAEGLGLGAALQSGNVSAGGKYQTFQLSAVVEDLPRMQAIDRAFREVPGVKMVL